MFNILFTTCKVQKIWGFIYTFYGHISSRRWRVLCVVLLSSRVRMLAKKRHKKSSLKVQNLQKIKSQTKKSCKWFWKFYKNKKMQTIPSTFCQILMSFAFFFATLKSHEKPSLPWHRAGLEIIAREGAEEYSRILPEVLPSGAVVEEEETKGNLGVQRWLD